MILPIDKRPPVCFARQSGLRVETGACAVECTRRCARNRRAIVALLSSIGLPPLPQRALPTRPARIPHDTTNRRGSR